MRTKAIIIIGAIIALLFIGAGAYVFINQSPEYKNITMNGVTFEVPKSNATIQNQTSHFSIYNDTQKNISIYVFDSENIGMNDLGDATTFAMTRESFQAGAKQQQSNNLQYNYSESLKVYTYLANYTHKNVFIVTKNKDDMEHIISKISVNNTNSTNDTNSTNETKAVQNNTTKKSSSDPNIVSETMKENKQAGDGSYYREVRYKDGNFRQYSTSGELIGSSFDSDDAQLRKKYGTME